MERNDMRAGDSERQATADKLKTALDEGRLDLHEYDERLQKTYSAKTFGDLDTLVTDLPGTIPTQQSRVEPYQAPSAPQTAATTGKKSKQQGAGQFVVSYGGVVLVCVIIWALTSLGSGELRYFWPGWMLIPLVFGLLGRYNNKNR
ncbi:DUF1707 SHOCT-like domain-containing protein [Actinoplanes friuliensis]|uniref:DUF1707 domain-containing protein n=1 Tax=Actinoplanes friuliensis DSM 7358 TaxID=1246995 RepID=U5VQI7_9ACTN|nr:DUF1707 domain-containing protein [Actinoplanes friuliensis]AGZ39213.1 hypothetical protein AFR_04620 [Actinoplanes friuliensis DSM 7358]